MIIRKSSVSDINNLLEIFDEARKTIATLGIDQWQNGYPSFEVVNEDISLSRSYAVEIDGSVCGTFVLIDDGEPTYNEIFEGEWLGNEDYIAIHRVAISVKNRGSGISTAIINYASDYAKSLGRTSLRIDTHSGNKVMRRMLEKHGFIHCGTIYLENGDPRVAYEKVLLTNSGK